jgi:hypothetical protein
VGCSISREVRLGTASLLTVTDGKFIDAQRLNMKNFIKRPALAVVGLPLLLAHRSTPLLLLLA